MMYTPVQKFYSLSLITIVNNVTLKYHLGMLIPLSPTHTYLLVIGLIASLATNPSIFPPSKILRCSLFKTIIIFKCVLWTDKVCTMIY